MKILIVEDEPDKFRNISAFIQVALITGECVHARSLNSALRVLEEDGAFDCLLLDMSLPTYDGSSGGTPQTFGGKDVMDILDAEGLEIPTILITQYKSFFESSGLVELNTIDAEFAGKYAWYKGAVHYSSGSDAWQRQLLKIFNLAFPTSIKR
jgi:CheY-like chemotaxis protein